MGCLGHGGVGPVGGLAPRRRPGGQDPLALARHPGRDPGRRLRHDPPANADKVPRHLHPGVRAGSRIHRHDRRARLRPRRHRPGTYLPEPGDKPARAQERVVLDRAAGADCHLCGLLPLVQEGAVNEALSGLARYDRLGGCGMTPEIIILLTNCLRYKVWVYRGYTCLRGTND